MNKTFQRVVIGIVLLIFVASSLIVYLPQV